MKTFVLLLIIFGIESVFGNNIVLFGSTNALANAGVGIAAMNSVCVADATNAGLANPENYQVLITYTGNAAYDSLPDSQPIINTNGEEISANRDTLFPQSGSTAGYTLGANVAFADGSTITSATFYTGTNTISSQPNGDDCSSWTSSTSGVGRMGSQPTLGQGVDFGWWVSSGGSCSFGRRIYCYSANVEISQDPIFNGFDGSHFEFQGLPDQVFNFISTKNFQMNAKFIPTGHGSVVGAVGIKTGSDEIYVDKNRTILINNDLVKKEEKEDIIRDTFQVRFTDENVIQVIAGAFRINIQFVDNERLDMNFGMKAKDIDSSVHGILGQTINNLGGKAKEGQDNMGLGVIEGSYVDYIESQIFSTDSVFSRFYTQSSRTALDKKNNVLSDQIFVADFKKF